MNQVSQSRCEEGPVFSPSERDELNEMNACPHLESEVFSTSESQTQSTCKKKVYREEGKDEVDCILRREDYPWFLSCLPSPSLPVGALSLSTENSLYLQSIHDTSYILSGDVACLLC